MPPMRTNSAMAEGTVLIKVTCQAAGSTGNWRAFSARMTVPPALSGTKSSKIERSKQIEVEKSTPASSCGEKIVLAQFTKVTGLWCSTATPFGLPVEPEV